MHGANRNKVCRWDVIIKYLQTCVFTSWQFLFNVHHIFLRCSDDDLIYSFVLLYLTRFAIAATREPTTHTPRKIVKAGSVGSPSIKSATSVTDQSPVLINHNIGTHKDVLVVFITVSPFLFYVYFPSAICLATYTPLADACEREWVMPLPSPMI